MKNFLRKFLGSLLSVGAVWGVVWLLSVAAVNLDFLNVFEQTLADFRITDLYFSQIRDKESVEQDTNVVVVNIGNLPRDGIGAQMQILAKYKPKAIGLDARLFKSKPEADSILINESLKNVSQKTDLIWVSELNAALGDSGIYKTNDDKEVWREIRKPNDKFLPYISTGYANLITEEAGATNSDFATTRSYPPKVYLSTGKKKEEYKVIRSFAVELAARVDSAAVNRYLKKARQEEFIYYKGNWDKFKVLDVADVFNENFKPEDVEGRVVLMGYLGNNYRDLTWQGDRFYTPLNPRQVGRTVPDMYGVFIHANIIAMILEGREISQIPEYYNFVFAFLMTLLNVIVFSRIYFSRRLGSWYDVLTKLVQLVEVIVLMFLTVYMFANAQLIFDFTPAIVGVLFSGDVLEVYLAFRSKVIADKRFRRIFKLPPVEEALRESANETN